MQPRGSNKSLKKANISVELVKKKEQTLAPKIYSW